MNDFTTLPVMFALRDMIVSACVILVVLAVLIWLTRDDETPPVPKRKKRFSDPLNEEEE